LDTETLIPDEGPATERPAYVAYPIWFFSGEIGKGREGRQVR
jgi:hypothetical protein